MVLRTPASPIYCTRRGHLCIASDDSPSLQRRLRLGAFALDRNVEERVSHLEAPESQPQSEDARISHRPGHRVFRGDRGTHSRYCWRLLQDGYFTASM